MLKKIAPDKWKHFFVGIAMGAVLQVFFRWLMPGSILTVTVITLIIVMIVSYGFELFSKFTGIGRYDFMDAVASVAGGVLGIGLIFIF